MRLFVPRQKSIYSFSFRIVSELMNFILQLYPYSSLWFILLNIRKYNGKKTNIKTKNGINLSKTHLIDPSTSVTHTYITSELKIDVTLPNHAHHIPYRGNCHSHRIIYYSSNSNPSLVHIRIVRVRPFSIIHRHRDNNSNRD